jgi:hypothetical protein
MTESKQEDSTKTAPSPTPQEQSVTGWKDIAGIIGTSVSTAQRRYKEGLPVMVPGDRGKPSALPSKLIAWMEERATRLSQTTPSGGPRLAATSRLLTAELNIPGHHVLITADLRLSAVTSRSISHLRHMADRWCDRKGDVLVKTVPKEIIRAFDLKNDIKTARNVDTEKAEVPLVRLVADPQVNDDHLGLLVAPVGWDLYTVTKQYPDKITDNKASSYIPSRGLLRTVQKYLERFPVSSRTKALGKAAISPRHVTPLGLEGLVVSSDGYALLRRKAATTTVGGDQWDVSFSGYARFETNWGFSVVDESRGLYCQDIGKWAAREFWRETGAEMTALDTESGVVFGVHQNMESGALDVLYAARTTLSKADLIDCLHLKKAVAQAEQDERATTHKTWTPKVRKQRRALAMSEIERSGVIPDSRGAREAAVQKTINVFRKFTPDGIQKMFADTNASGQEWLPEARYLLIKALEVPWA